MLLIRIDEGQRKEVLDYFFRNDKRTKKLDTRKPVGENLQILETENEMIWDAYSLENLIMSEIVHRI